MKMSRERERKLRLTIMIKTGCRQKANFNGEDHGQSSRQSGITSTTSFKDLPMQRKMKQGTKPTRVQVTASTTSAYTALVLARHLRKRRANGMPE